MKVTLTFDYHEDYDSLKDMINYRDPYIACHDIKNYLRGIWKHGYINNRELTEQESEFIDKIYEEVCSIFNQNNIDV